MEHAAFESYFSLLLNDETIAINGKFNFQWEFIKYLSIRKHYDSILEEMNEEFKFSEMIKSFLIRRN